MYTHAPHIPGRVGNSVRRHKEPRGFHLSSHHESLPETYRRLHAALVTRIQLPWTHRLNEVCVYSQA